MKRVNPTVRNMLGRVERSRNPSVTEGGVADQVGRSPVQAHIHLGEAAPAVQALLGAGAVDVRHRAADLGRARAQRLEFHLRVRRALRGARLHASVRRAIEDARPYLLTRPLRRADAAAAAPTTAAAVSGWRA